MSTEGTRRCLDRQSCQVSYPADWVLVEFVNGGANAARHFASESLCRLTNLATSVAYWVANLACGGNARCSTCRVVILEGLEYCVARNDSEQKLADRLDVYVAREAIETWAARKLIESSAELDLSKLPEL